MKPHPEKVDELDAVRKVAEKLMLAVKNAAFYPSDHAVVRDCLSGLYAELSDFFSRKGPLVLDVRNGVLAYGGQPLARGTDSHESIAYMCYRDGIQAFAFDAIPDIADLEAFIRILSSRRVLEDESEGDIVTDLWEAGLSGIRYTTNDKLWQNESLLDISRLKVTGETKMGSEYPEKSEVDENPSCPAPELCRLTPEELVETRRMVAEEENRYFDDDVFDVFLVMLEEQREREDFVTMLDIIRQCFQRTLARGEFRSAGRFLFNMRRIRHHYDTANHWALPYLDDFLLMVSGPKDLSVLTDGLSTLDGQDKKALQNLEYLLVRTSPESVLALIPMLEKIRNARVRRVLFRSIRKLSARDARPLYQLVRNATPQVARHAVAVLGQLSDKEHLPVILEAARSPDALVRHAGIEALLVYDPPEYAQLLPFLQDDDERLQEKVFAFLMRTRRPDAEPALQQYLQQQTFSQDHRQSLLRGYRALGGCGTDRSLDFLRNRLLAQPWRINKIRSLHRLGAAVALAAHPHPMASDIFHKAAKALWPNIRRACRNAKDFRDGNRERIG